TAHANFRTRNSSRCRCFYRRVAVAAIDAIVPRVMLMTKLNGLIARDTNLGRIIGPVDPREKKKRPQHQKDRAKNAHARERNGRWMKDLRHRLSLKTQKKCRRDYLVKFFNLKAGRVPQK